MFRAARASLAARYGGHPFRLVLAMVKTLGLLHLLHTRGLAVGAGSGPSMLPTFQVAGDYVVVDKRRHRRGRDVALGDCVVYAIPVKPGEEGVKRVLGMPGDYVLLNSPEAPNDDMIQVPQGHCYIVGDNLPWSLDSRDFGPLPLALIKGKVVAKAQPNGWNPFNWFVPVPGTGLQSPSA